MIVRRTKYDFLGLNAGGCKGKGKGTNQAGQAMNTYFSLEHSLSTTMRYKILD